MWRRLAWALFTARGLVSCAQVVDVAIDVTVAQQTLDVGFGTSLCWFANGIGSWQNMTAFNDVMDLLFSNTSTAVLGVTDGLGLNFVRYNIGGGENPVHLNFMRPGGYVEGFLCADGTYDWTADATQRRVLLQALARGVQHVHAFSNSPPYFMTNSGSVTGASDGGNNLQDAQYDAFAVYLARVVQHFQTTGADFGNVVFDTVTPLNEPVSNWWKFGGDQEGCHFDRDKQAVIVQKLSSALRALGVNHTLAHAPEENSIDDALTSMQSYGHPTVQQLGLITTHTYNGNNRAALAAFAAANGQRLWNSEFGTGSGPLQGGLQLAQQIILDLRYLQVPTWTLWQAADLDNTLGPSGWGLLAATYSETPAQQLVLGDPAGTVCLGDTTGLVADGDVVGTVACSSGGLDPRQAWVLQGGAVQLGNGSGLAMDDWGGAMQPGDAVRLYSFWNGPNQVWVYVNNTLRLNNASGLCLTGNTAADAPVSVEICDGGQAQRWYTRSFPTRRRGAAAPVLSSRRQCAAGETPTRWTYCRPHAATTAPQPTDAPDEYAIRKQFYAFRQFTAFVRPGYQILNISDPSNSVLAAVSPDKLTLVLVVVNGAQSPVTFALDVLTGWTGSEGQAFQTDGYSQNCVAVAWPPAQGTTLSPTLPALSILTLRVPLRSHVDD